MSDGRHTPDDYKKTFEKILKGQEPLIRTFGVDFAKGSPSIYEFEFPIKPQDGEVEALKARGRRLEGRINELGKEKLFLQGRVASLERLVEGLNELLAMVPAPVPAWIKKHLRFLIFACHPDRNKGRQEAAEVTRKLLALRGK